AAPMPHFRPRLRAAWTARWNPLVAGRGSASPRSCLAGARLGLPHGSADKPAGPVDPACVRSLRGLGLEPRPREPGDAQALCQSATTMALGCVQIRSTDAPLRTPPPLRARLS